MNKLKNTHPGEVLKHDFLIPMGISQSELSRATHLSTTLISAIVMGSRNITAMVDVRFSKALGTSMGFWLGLQSDYDIGVAMYDLYVNIN